MGRPRPCDQVQLATFNNPAGLLKVGQNHYQQSAVSGVANIGVPGVGGRGILTPGNLEASNVDLATRVHLDDPGADRLLGQRADHPVSNEMLKEVINISR